MNRPLHAEYRRLYAKTRALLAIDVPPGTERDHALAEFADLLADAEQRGEQISDLFGLIKSLFSL